MVKPVFQIDAVRFSTLDEFFDEIERVLIPGAAWGRNLDAFNHILRGGFGTPAGGFVLHWKLASLSRERLGYAETVRQLEARLRQCHPSAKASVEADLQRANAGIGSTVFDWLIGIILEHCDVELVLE